MVMFFELVYVGDLEGETSIGIQIKTLNILKEMYSNFKVVNDFRHDLHNTGGK